MHVLLLILGAIGTISFYLWRASQAAPHVIDAAQTVANLPRRRRHAKAVNRKGLDLVETPVEAATVLMLSISRMGDDRRLSPAEREMIEGLLVSRMQMEPDDADGLVLQMEMVQDAVTLPETALFPMTDILRAEIDRKDARGLAEMMEAVAQVDGETAEQREFIRRYRERLNLS